MWAQNNILTVSKYSYESSNIPQEFDGYRIVQISDLHNKEFGQNNAWLLRLISKQDPDMIVITGDLIDSNHPDFSATLNFAKEAGSYAPVFFISGNHESYIDQTDYQSYLSDLKTCGVTILDDRAQTIKYGNSVINLIGLADPEMQDSLLSNGKSPRNEVIKQFVRTDTVNIVLSHRPELFEYYADVGFNLVLSGHAHGGQFRFPMIGGVYAPNQGFFPKYTKGIYRLADTEMVVSRGLGNSNFPLRLFNFPEVVVVDLMSQQ